MSLSRKQASTLFADARRLFDQACMAYRRTNGTLDSAPLLQKSLYAAVSLVVRLREGTPGGYEETVHQAQRINAEMGLLGDDISTPLLALAEASARQAAASSDDDLDSLRQRYRDIFTWAPDLLRAVRAANRRHFGPRSALLDPEAWRVPAQAFVATRAALLMIAYFGLRFVPAKHTTHTSSPLNPWLDAWVRWDASWFYSTVVRGYDAVGAGQSSNVVFFPLFPALATVIAVPLQLLTDAESAYWEAAFILAHAAFLFGLAGLRRLGVRLVGAPAAHRAVWLLALFPFSFFFSAPYPQSLFFALATWSVALGLEGRWLLAASLASLAAVTFQHGLVLPLVLTILCIRIKKPAGKKRTSLLPVIGIAIAAPVLLLAYFERRYGEPFIFVREYFGPWGAAFGFAHWERALGFIRADPPLSEGLPFLWSMGLVPITGVLAYRVWRRCGAALGIFCAAPALLGIFVMVLGFGRLVAATFPLFLWLGWRIRDRAAFTILCGLFVPTLAYFTYVFCHWGPVGGP